MRLFQRTKAGMYRWSRGFTVIELLVAAALMTVLVALVLALLSPVLNRWHGVAARVGVDQQARLTLERLTHDLQAAYFSREGGPWLIYEERSNAGSPATGFWLRFIANTADDPMNELANGLRVVGYWTDSINPIRPNSAENRQPALLSAALSGEDTFKAFFVDKARTLWTETPATLCDPMARDDALVCTGLVEASIRFIIEDHAIVSSTVAFPYATADGKLYTAPVAAEVTLVYLNDEGMKTWAAIQRGEITRMDFEQIKSTHGQRFLRRIPFLVHNRQ
ncbi:MAG: prepilin-type N-terminal cleavage/methylation domain-containing protein [Verrucomicrobiota bacterium]|nr:prepilin-type N-terminal cleavage/methylation domain-containing protein [Verrucomicrobiota bacterium]